MHFSFSRVPQRILPISGRDLFTHPIAPLLPSLPLTRELPFDFILSTSGDSRLKDLFFSFPSRIVILPSIVLFGRVDIP